MESEVEPDSDHDDTDHDLSHGHWMGHPDDPNKVRSFCEVKGIHLLLLQALRQAVISKKDHICYDWII